MDPWYLVKDGSFAEAIASYSERIAENATPPSFSSRGIAYLNLGDIESAARDFERSEHAVDTSDGARKWRGVCHWLAGRHNDAVDLWADAVSDLQNGRINYTDGAQGAGVGVLLWFAGVRLQREELCDVAEKHLKRICRSKRIGTWPGPIAQFVLGRIDAEDLMSRTSERPVLSAREKCQAEFHIAASKFRNGSEEEYVAGMQAAAAHTEALLERELYLARHECEHPN